MHGMVIVPTGNAFIASCLCGWWEPKHLMFDMARYEWTLHEEESR